MIKPKCKEYRTDSGLHAAMQAWARSKDKPEVTVTVIFTDNDNDPFICSFEPAAKESFYKTADGESYSVNIDVAGSYKVDFLPEYLGDTLPLVKLKKLFKNWLLDNNSENTIKSIKWTVGE